jgi:hypothetical protein
MLVTMRDSRVSSRCPAIAVHLPCQRRDSPLNAQLDEAARRTRAEYGMLAYITDPAIRAALGELLATWLDAQGG